MLAEDPMTEKIKKVYRKNNYNNISIFPTIDSNVVLPSVTLEGLKSTIIDDYEYTADKIFNPNKGSKKPKPPLETDKKTQSNGQSYEELNSKINQYKSRTNDKISKIYNSVSNVGSLLTGNLDFDPNATARQFQSQQYDINNTI